MFKRLKNIVSVIFSFFKFCFIKIIRFREFSFHLVERFSPSTMVNIHKKGRMILGNKLRVHSGTRLSVTSGALLSVGDNTAFNYNCIIVARKSVKIGKGCTFGPNVCVFDHDHDFRNSDEMNGTAYQCEEIVIGNNVWIGANAIILKGSKIGDDSVIGAGTIVTGTVPPHSVAFDKKEMEMKNY